LFHKGLFEILHFYSTSNHHPQTTPSVLKLEGWNFAHRLPILIAIIFEFLSRSWDLVLKKCWYFISNSLDFHSLSLIGLTILKLDSKIKHKDSMEVFLDPNFLTWKPVSWLSVTRRSLRGFGIFPIAKIVLLLNLNYFQITLNSIRISSYCRI